MTAQILDNSWLDNRNNSQVCKDFVLEAMKTGAPERATFRHVQTRLNTILSSSDPDKRHMLYRAFPDIFYLKLNNNKLITSELQAIKDFSGLIIGDVHVENFGIIRVNNKYKLMVNDFDEAGHGPYYSDLLRLISSAKLAERNFKPYIIKSQLNCLIKAYKAGLNGDQVACRASLPSARVKKRIQKSKKDYALSFGAVDLNNMNNPCSKTPESLIDLFTPEIPKEYFSNALSHKHRCKMTGGSGLLRSVQFLEQELIKGRKRNQIMETKMISQKSALFQIAPKMNLDHAGNMKKLISLYGLEETLQISGNNFKYVTREKDGGNKSYRPYKQGKGDKVHRAQDMLMDQFFILGKMHKKSLNIKKNRLAQYLKILKSLNRYAWSKSSDKLVEEFENIFQACSLKSSKSSFEE